MEQPVGISFLGGFLIVGAAGCLGGFMARLLLATTTVHMLVDMGLGMLGGYIVIFLLPMHGYPIGNFIGWKAAVILGAVLPIIAKHLICAHATRH